MSSEWSGDRNPAPAPSSRAGQKRTAPDEFANAEQAKRRQNIPTSSFQKGSDGDRSTAHPDRLRTRFVESERPALASHPASANAVRRFSFNDGSRHKDFSPLTRSGTGLPSPDVETALHSDGSMFTNASHTSVLLQLMLKCDSQHTWPSV